MFLKGGVSIGAEMDSWAAETRRSFAFVPAGVSRKDREEICKIHVPILVFLTQLVSAFWSHLLPHSESMPWCECKDCRFVPLLAKDAHALCFHLHFRSVEGRKVPKAAFVPRVLSQFRHIARNLQPRLRRRQPTCRRSPSRSRQNEVLRTVAPSSWLAARCVIISPPGPMCVCVCVYDRTATSGPSGGKTSRPGMLSFDSNHDIALINGSC